MNGHASRRNRLAPTFLFALLALPATAQECSSWFTVWQDESPSRAKRAALEEAARERAIDDLARRAFSVVLREEDMREVRRVRSGGAEEPAGFSEDLLFVDVARSYYEIDAKLQGGATELNKAKKRATLRYCVDSEKFRRARENVKARRERRVESVRRSFAVVEDAVRRNDVGLVGQLLPDLKNEVSRAVLDVELYRSPRTGVSRRFSDWLREWSELAGRGREYAVYNCDRARDAINRAHLAEADLFVAEGLKVDSREVVCLQLRDRVGGLREERRSLLRKAGYAAEAGRFPASDDLIARARAIDVDDTTALEEAERTVQTARTEFRRNNPPVRFGVVLGWGGLLVDPDATADAMKLASVPGSTLAASDDSGSGTSMLIDLQIRLGRHGFSFGEYGIGGESSTNFYGASTDLYSTKHMAGGLGLKTLRKGSGLARWELSGAVVSQEVTVAGSPGAGETKTGAVARVGLDAGRFYLFVQRTFLFEEETATTGLVKWGDQYLGGIGLWLF